MKTTISLKATLINFIKDENGGAAVEYAFVAGLIFLGVATGMHIYAKKLSGYYVGFTSEIQKVMTP